MHTECCGTPFFIAPTHIDRNMVLLAQEVVLYSRAAAVEVVMVAVAAVPLPQLWPKQLCKATGEPSPSLSPSQSDV